MKKKKENQKTLQKTEKIFKKKQTNKHILLSEPGLEFNCVWEMRFLS